MKVLLDEDLPHDLRKHLVGHDVHTVSYAGLAGRPDGEVLRHADEAGFETLVTSDKNLEHQQKLIGQKVALIVLSVHELKFLLPYIDRILAAIEASQTNPIQHVECGRFTRKFHPKSGL